MPFIRKTPRWPSRHVITLSDLTMANWQVIDEMEKLGFWHEWLEDIDVCLVPVSFACYGGFLPDGHIYIPAVTGAHLCDLITGHHTRLAEGVGDRGAHDNLAKTVSIEDFRASLEDFH